VVAAAIESADGEIQGCGGQIDDQRWLQGLVDAAFTGGQLLVGLLQDEHPLARVGALIGLTAILDGWAEDWTRRLLKDWPVTWHSELWGALDDPAPEVRAAALRALTRLPADPGEAVWLEGSLYDPSTEVREAAVGASARHLGRDVEGRLLELATARDDDSAARAAAVQLVELDSPLTAQALRARLQAGAAPVETLSLIVRAGLPEMPGADLAALLVEASPEPVRRAAAKALVEWVDEASKPALVRALASGDHAAIYAAIALGRSPAAGAEGALIQTLMAPAPALKRRSERAALMLRDAAARALGAAATPLAREALLESPFRLPDARGNGPNAAALCGALGMMEHPDAAPRIQQLLGGNLYTRRIAGVALGQCGEPYSASQLRRWVRDESDPRLRAHAALGLLLLRPDRVDVDAMALLRHPPPPVVTTYEGLALSLGSGLRTLGRRVADRPASADALAACLAWARSHREAIDRITRCYRGRGDCISYNTAYAFWIRDLFEEAEALLSAAVGGAGA